VAIFFSGGCIMSLKKVAAKMHVEAKELGVSRRVLTGGFVTADNHSRGLMLNLWYRENDIVLGLRRRNVKPSETEISICDHFLFLKALRKQSGKRQYRMDRYFQKCSLCEKTTNLRFLGQVARFYRRACHRG
jgi:hypothetical protein